MIQIHRVYRLIKCCNTHVFLLGVLSSSLVKYKWTCHVPSQGHLFRRCANSIQFYNTLVWKLLPSSAVKRWLYLVKESIFPFVLMFTIHDSSRLPKKNLLVSCGVLRSRQGLFKSASQSTASASAGSLEVNEAVRKFPSRPKPADSLFKLVQHFFISVYQKTHRGKQANISPWRLSCCDCRHLAALAPNHLEGPEG